MPIAKTDSEAAPAAPPQAREAGRGQRASEEPSETRYIETSALVAAFVEGDVDARTAIRSGGRRVISALTITEAQRAAVRLRATGRLDAEKERALALGLRRFAARCDVVPMNDEILGRAGRPFPIEPIRTLDALHVATVVFLGEPPPLVTVVTRDSRVAENAQAMGYRVAP